VQEIKETKLDNYGLSRKVVSQDEADQLHEFLKSRIYVEFEKEDGTFVGSFRGWPYVFAETLNDESAKDHALINMKDYLDSSVSDQTLVAIPKDFKFAQ
jgi:hypothetical protein